MADTKTAQGPGSRLDEALAKLKPKKTRKLKVDIQNQSELKSDIRNQSERPVSQTEFEARLKESFQNQKALAVQGQGLTHKQYRSAVALSAQQYADLEAKKHAHVAGDMIRNCVSDMSNILNELRTKIDFAEPGELKTVTDTYAMATRELRRALGIIEQDKSIQPSALVQVQCVGQVSVSAGVSESEPIDVEELPSLSEEFDSSPLSA